MKYLDVELRKHVHAANYKMQMNEAKDQHKWRDTVFLDGKTAHQKYRCI